MKINVFEGLLFFGSVICIGASQVFPISPESQSTLLVLGGLLFLGWLVIVAVNLLVRGVIE